MSAPQVDEAEDLVQETYLRAWRSYDSFDGRSSLRTWLHRIATNACLTALETRRRRPLPTGLGGPADDPGESLVLGPPGTGWLEPVPTLLLRDVLGWRAAEVADLLGTSVPAVKSSLQRARARIAEVAPAYDEVDTSSGQDRSDLLDRYVAAFETADLGALIGVLEEDARLEMPPFRTWFSGREAVARFLASRVLTHPGEVTMLPVDVNGQQGLAAYLRDGAGVRRAHALHVLTSTPTGLSAVVVFLGAEVLDRFGLPRTLPDAIPS